MNNLTAAGLALIKTFEQLRLTAYSDAAGVWTIGYGHTGPDVSDELVIRPEEAERLLTLDLGRFERYVAGCVMRAPATTDSQFSAMVSLAYNIGCDAFRGSSVLRFHLQSKYPQAMLAFMLWDKAHVDGDLVILPGLVDRRYAEANLYGEDDL